ncbi:MAG: right-handed parallel beta-helix repeat-containing protein [Thermoplasmata archaeon]|nr:right-handed parallel beta-helix repeat-containing protein [Thermoplasmata archaeon]TFG70886.1 MAG: hypothetical protein E4H25_00730 [Methanomassiliicoccus sp.]
MDPGGLPHYFGPYPNYANSPLPTGPVATITVDSGGTGYSAPVIELSDVYGTGSGAMATATVTAGVITDISITSGGAGYSAPIVSITDTTGSGAAATALIEGDLTGGIRKFIDSLAGLGETNANNLGNYIPVAVPDTTTYPGCDYYEIALVQFTQQMHTDLPETLLRGYVQLETPFNVGISKHVQLTNPDSTPILLANGTQAIGIDEPYYLGPTIISSRDTPTRIKFSNLLPTGSGGDLFLPVDTTVMGSGMGPLASVHHIMVTDGGSGYTSAPTVTITGGGGSGAMAMAMLVGDAVDHVMVIDGGLGYNSVPSISLDGGDGTGAAAEAMIMFENYTENRATVHLHGGFVPWISDGTPHQWTTPAGETTQYPVGVSVQYVPDMWFVNGTVVPDTIGMTEAPVIDATNDPGDGSLTFYYNNQQSARLMFYHDHAYGITRLNVYAGEVSDYILTDSVEEELINAGILPTLPGDSRYGIPLVIQDKTFVDASTMPYQDPTWAWGSNPGTPETGDLWMPHVYMPNQNPGDPGGMNAFGRWHYGPWFWPPTTDVKYGPVPNPYYDPINAPWEPPFNPGVPSNSMAMEAYMDTPTVNGVAYPYLDIEPQAYRFRILSVGNDRVFNLQLYVADSSVTTSDGRTNTEVKMVPAESTLGYPELWPTDGREGGVPDPATAGPSFIQIGTEGGFLPAPAVIENQPVTWNLDPTTFTMGNVQDHSLMLGPAERADVVIDFSAFAGKTLILYNDAPAAFPARDARYDYHTGGPDLTSSGGTPPTQPGYGPNMRTIMQIRVGNTTPAPSYNLNALNGAFEKTPTKRGVFESSQDTIIVPQAAYNSAYDKSFPEDTYVRIMDTSLTFETVSGNVLTIPFQSKAIQDEMGEAYETDYGRMSGMMGLELPSTSAINQNFILYGYPSPPVDVLVESLTQGEPIDGDGTQIWKITHNGVDTHTVHTHLFNMQLINRVAWDNAISPPDANELGWKETIRVNPLEDTIVAVRPVAPTQPFEIPNSVRPIDPTMPLGVEVPGPPGGFLDPNANPVTVVNHLVNYGWEYVMHCHLLGHEEMDMMHGVVVGIAPFAPTGLNATLSGIYVNMTWTDGSISETGYYIETSLDSIIWSTVGYLDSPFDTTGTTKGTLMYYNDTVVADGTIYYYRVLANKVVGDTADYGPGLGFTTESVNSTSSNNIIVDTSTGTVTPLAVAMPSPPIESTKLASLESYPVDTPFSRDLVLSTLALGASYTDHAPIRIDSNSDFDATHGVTSGNGTVWAPWVIEGLRIDASGYGYGIYVGNTTDHFTVRDCELSNAVGGVFSFPYSPESGMIVYNVTNGIIANNLITNNGWSGTYIYMSQSITLYNNTVTGNYMGIYLRSTNNSILSYNNVSDNFGGIWLYGSNFNLIENNTDRHNYPGIFFATSDSNVIVNNIVFANVDYGIWLHDSDIGLIYDNDLIGNYGSNSTFNASHIQAYDDRGTYSWNSTSESNYWSDWTGPDIDLNGVVDGPYVIGGNAGAIDYKPRTVQVIPDQLSAISVIPSMVSVIAGSVQLFAAYAYNQYGNIITGTTFTWTTNVGSMTGNSLAAQTVAGVTGYVRASSGGLWGDAMVTIVIGMLHHIDVAPSSMNIVINMPQQFTATGMDAYNNTVSGLTFSWATTMGSISSSGLLIAPSIAGLTGWVNVSAGEKTGTAVFTTIAGPLTHILVTPGDIEIAAGTTYDFTAVGYDDDSNPIPGIEFEWTTNIGTVSDGTFTAQTTAGTTGYVRATSGFVSGEASVTITPGELYEIEITPGSLSAVAGTSAQFNASGHDEYGNSIAGILFSWTTDVGTIDDDGLFTAQEVAGVSGYVNASANDLYGIAIVTISTDQLTHISVAPGSVDVEAGTTHIFIATGYDQYENEIPALSFTWTTNVGVMDESTLNAQTMAGASGHVMANCGFVSRLAFVTIVPGSVDAIVLAPTSVNMIAGTEEQFDATAMDEYENTISSLAFEWTSDVGIITNTGTLTAQTAAGATGYVQATYDGVIGTATVVVVSDQPTHIALAPETIEIAAGSSLEFEAVAYDQYDNMVPDISFTWDTDIGTMVDSVLLAQMTAGYSGFVIATSGLVSGYAVVVIVPDELAAIDISPSLETVIAGSEIQFDAIGADIYGNVISNASFTWTTTIGTITSDGLFITRTTVGSNGYVEASNGSVTASVTLTVVPDQLTHIVLSPTTMQIIAGAAQTFAASGYDQYGNIITGLSFQWATSVGTIVAGVFTAQTVSGASGYVRATSNLVIGYAPINIVPGPLETIIITPLDVTVVAGSQTQFSATAHDEYNNSISDLTFEWSTLIGSVSDEGLFTAQTTAGVSGYLNATVDDVTTHVQIEIVPDQLTHIVVSEPMIDVIAGRTENFTAIGYDQYENAVPDLAFTWTTNVGVMAGNMLTAQNASDVTGYVRATSGQVYGDASVTIVPVPHEVSKTYAYGMSALAAGIIAMIVIGLILLRRRGGFKESSWGRKT